MRGSVRQKGPGRWELRVPLPPDRVTGERRRRSLSFAGTKREAERELARLVGAADDDRRGADRATVSWIAGGTRSGGAYLPRRVASTAG